LRRRSAATKRSWIRKNSAGAAEFLRNQLRNARKETNNREVVVRMLFVVEFARRTVPFEIWKRFGQFECPA
jgi:hypothetical protein